MAKIEITVKYENYFLLACALGQSMLKLSQALIEVVFC